MVDPESSTFTVTPGKPTLVLVNDPAGVPYQVAVQAIVLGVRPTGTKNPTTGHSVFEVDFQVTMETKPKQ